MNNPNSVTWPKTNEGGLRRLRIGEIYLASSLYHYSIHYNKVWVHLESYLPFNLQPANIAMAPNGEMWFRQDNYEDDFSAPQKEPSRTATPFHARNDARLAAPARNVGKNEGDVFPFC